ncbi:MULTISPECIES: hypothetical protein [Streptomycetaceae]|uniref:hypothetical protein n=1 Tax=Streptomycetaceae TaxID=2062 RepID=UPI000967969F|nr:hypothetical protein [Streptomyces sp. CB02056]OKI00500.1 hypothetical protein AMK13_32945 [Streptomyces sp. CB02056]
MNRTRLVLAGVLATGTVVAGLPSASADSAPTVKIVASDWSKGGWIAKATCPSGYGLVGGGQDARLDTNGFGALSDGVEANAPDPNSANTWTVQAKTGSVRAIAMCAKDAPVPTVVASDWSQDHWIAKATCPAGKHLIGGGQDARLQTMVTGDVDDDVELNAPDANTPDTWSVQAKKGQARAMALCATGAPAAKVVVSDWSKDGWIAKATCPSGYGLVGGGQDARLDTNGFGALSDGVEANAPDPNSANTWMVQAKSGPVRSFAMCVTGAPVPTVVASDWSPDGRQVRAACPQGTQLAGGGQDARLRTTATGDVDDDVELNAPDPQNPNTWTVRAHSGQSRALAMCTP